MVTFSYEYLGCWRRGGFCFDAAAAKSCQVFCLNVIQNTSEVSLLNKCLSKAQNMEISIIRQDSHFISVIDSV